MSELPATSSDEAGAIAMLQNLFPGVHEEKFLVVLRSWGGGSETTHDYSRFSPAAACLDNAGEVRYGACVVHGHRALEESFLFILWRGIIKRSRRCVERHRRSPCPWQVTRHGAAVGSGQPGNREAGREEA